MSQQLITDVISTIAKPVDTFFELGVDREILLADYDKPVFKIVKTIADHSITQKYINGNKLMIEGFFRITVFYQPPGGDKLTVISKKQPFRKQLDLSAAIHEPYFAKINGSLQYINTRAINSTRIAINGVYQFDVCLYCSEKTAVATAIDSKTSCADSEETVFFSLCGSGIKQFSSEDEIQIPADMDKILHITSKNGAMTINCYQDKVNVKGDIYADVVFTTQGEEDIKHIIKKFSYNQIIDIPGVTELSVAYADTDTLGFTVSQNTDSSKINCIISAYIDVKAFTRQSVITVRDAFSKSFQYEKNIKMLQTDKNITSVNKTAICTVEDTVAGEYIPVYSFVNVSQPETAFSNGKNILRSKATVSVIVINRQKEYECFTKSGEIVLDTGKEINIANIYMLNCNVSEKEVSINSGIMKAVFSVDLTGFVLERNEFTVLDEYSENTDLSLSQPENALILYYADKGEKVFDIAMKYHTDVSAIIEENSLETKTMSESRMLFVPQYGL